MTRYTVGLDVHSKQSVFAIQDAEGRFTARGSVPTTPEGFESLRTKHELPPGTRVGLETGTVAFYAARLLLGLGLEPVVIDAHEVRLKAYRPTQKSDRRDAEEICEGLRRGIYRSIVHIPPPQITALRDTLSRRRHFVRLKTAEMNAVKRLLRSAGLGRQARSLRTLAGWEKLLAALAQHIDLLEHVKRLQAVWRCADEQVVALDAQLAVQEVPFAEDVRRLQTVPGVGPIVALTTLAVLSDISRFPSTKHAASYAGLVPSTHQSGDRDAHGRITKRGSAELRAMLCEAAHHASRSAHPLNPYFMSLCVRRGYKMAVVAVAHRLCRILFTMLRRRTDFDIKKLGIEVGPFEKTQVKLYRLRKAQAVQA